MVCEASECNLSDCLSSSSSVFLYNCGKYTLHGGNTVLYTFKHLSMTLVLFQGHRSIKQLLKFAVCMYLVVLYSLQSNVYMVCLNQRLTHAHNAFC